MTSSPRWTPDDTRSTATAPSGDPVRAPNYRHLKKQREEAKRREAQERLVKRNAKPAADAAAPPPKDDRDDATGA